MVVVTELTTDHGNYRELHIGIALLGVDFLLKHGHLFQFDVLFNLVADGWLGGQYRVFAEYALTGYPLTILQL